MRFDVFYFQGESVRVPAGWDVVTFRRRIYTRRRHGSGRHAYWVDSSGRIIEAHGLVSKFAP